MLLIFKKVLKNIAKVFFNTPLCLKVLNFDMVWSLSNGSYYQLVVQTLHLYSAYKQLESG